MVSSFEVGFSENNGKMVWYFGSQYTRFKKKNFLVILALFEDFKCKCEKNCTFTNILQKVKSYFLPISIILRLINFETLKPPSVHMYSKIGYNHKVQWFWLCLTNWNLPDRRLIKWDPIKFVYRYLGCFAPFSTASKSASNSSYSMPTLFFWRIFFGLYEHFLQTLNANADETAKKTRKLFCNRQRPGRTKLYSREVVSYSKRKGRRNNGKRQKREERKREKME